MASPKAKTPPKTLASPRLNKKLLTKIKNTDVALNIKGENALEIPSPKIAVIITKAKPSSNSSLNLKPFSLIARPEIMQRKDKKVISIVVKIRFSRII